MGISTAQTHITYTSATAMGHFDTSREASRESSPLLVKAGHDEVSDKYKPNCDVLSHRLRRWLPLFLFVGLICFVGIAKQFIEGIKEHQPLSSHESYFGNLNVAFVGNSMFYFNDRVYQNSCLHGGGSIPSLLMEGNAMWPQFMTGNAVINQRPGHHEAIYDFGACTPKQLMTGVDPRLNDPGYAQPTEVNATNFNPCRQDPYYLKWSQSWFKENTPNWDVVVINDNTQSPATFQSRARSMAFLNEFWLPILKRTGATPVFLWTHAYRQDSMSCAPSRNMTGSGLEDIANFTSLTYSGLKSYVNILTPNLPESQTPRIAPVGLAFLVVYEEDPELWKLLFHCDELHASPSGSFLQACIVHYTLFGEMPDRDHVVRQHMSSLWKTARMMQHAWEPPNPFPTTKQAEYLYHVAERIMVHGHVPSSFIDYKNGEAAYVMRK